MSKLCDLCGINYGKEAYGYHFCFKCMPKVEKKADDWYEEVEKRDKFEDFGFPYEWDDDSIILEKYLMYAYDTDEELEGGKSE